MRKKLLFFGTLGGLLILPLFSSAKGLVPCGGAEEDPCNLCYFFQMFKNIIDFIMVPLVPIVAVLMLVIGGAMFFFSAGNPGNVARARSVITSTVLGVIIVYVAWILVNMFFAAIGVADWTGLLGGGWSTINCEIPLAP